MDTQALCMGTWMGFVSMTVGLAYIRTLTDDRCTRLVFGALLGFIFIYIGAIGFNFI